MVAIVKALAERQERDEPTVGGIILALEWPAAPDVAVAVHKRRDVLMNEHPHCPAPQETEEGTFSCWFM